MSRSQKLTVTSSSKTGCNPTVSLAALRSLTSVRVKRVLEHRARRGAPKPLLFRARRARNSKGFSLSRIHVSLYQRGYPNFAKDCGLAVSQRD